MLPLWIGGKNLAQEQPELRKHLIPLLKKTAAGQISFPILRSTMGLVSPRDIQKGLAEVAKGGVIGKFRTPLLLNDLDFSTFEWKDDGGGRGLEWRVYRKGTKDYPYAYGFLFHYWVLKGKAVEVNCWWDIKLY